MLHILVGGNVEDYQKIISGKPKLKGWVVPKRAMIDDDFIMFVERDGFLARGRVATSPLAGFFKNRPAYRSDLRDVSLLPAPLPLAQIAKAIPTWGWVRQRSKGYNTPEPEIAEQLLSIIDGAGEAGAKKDAVVIVESMS